MNKVKCPFHKNDDTPSLHLYYNTNAYHCFGCGAHGKLNEYLKVDSLPPPEEPFVEDVAAKIAQIEQLPTKQIRGFDLHYDDYGYFLVWPDKSYYLKRFLDGDSSNKYKGPSGHGRPLFRINDRGDRSVLYVVEGEFNAMSLGTLEGLAGTIASPGGCGNFYARKYDVNLPYYRSFDQVYIIADLDKAGAIAAIELKAKLPDKDVKIILMPEDANDIMVKYGKETLRMEMQRRLRGDSGTMPPPGETTPQHAGG